MLATSPSDSEVRGHDEGTVPQRKNVPSHDGHGAPYALGGDYFGGRVSTSGQNLP